MLFITFLNIVNGKFTEAIKMIKNPKKTNDITIIDQLGIFGTPDAVIIFEATDERAAAEFVTQFAEVAQVKTALAFSADKFKWTH